MKVTSLMDRFGFMNRTERKDDAGQDPQHKQKKKDQNPSKDDQGFTPFQATDDDDPDHEKVEAAVEAFGNDSQAQAHGLSVSTEGEGFGLRVFLKDGTGAVIRQFTGEEFVKMREAVGKDGRGKILDQKL